MNANDYYSRIDRAATAIKSIYDHRIDWLLVLGSGLGGLAELAESAISIPFSEIPGFPESTVPGHAGRLVFGSLHGKNLAIMQGRFHAYEGHAIAAPVLPISVLTTLGAAHLLLTNAAGS